MRRPRTAAVVGSGPNGLAAAVVLARAGLAVTVYEGAATPGGGLRTEEFWRDDSGGFIRDVCSAVHPMVLPSPFFRVLGIEQGRVGVGRAGYAVPEISYAHALAPDRAVAAYRDIERTAAGLGADGPAWTRLLGPLAARADELLEIVLGPLLRTSVRSGPAAHPSLTARFGARVVEQAGTLGRPRWRGDAAPALLSGALAHGMARLPSLAASAAGLVLAATAHARGWPVPVGGARVLAAALIAEVEAAGGRVRTGTFVSSLGELREDLVIADVSARGLAQLARGELPRRFRDSLLHTRYGPGIAKIDLALSGPVPWADPLLARAATVHVGGTASAVAHSEAAVLAGEFPAEPFVLAVQPGVVDDSRAPAGKSVLWAYAHAPTGDTADRSAAILSRLDRFAPGLRERVEHVRFTSAADAEAGNPNYVGGDIASGALSAWRLIARPVFSREPWRTPVLGLYLGSAATVPGPGVHGMAGFWAAATALADAGIPLPREFTLD